MPNGKALRQRQRKGNHQLHRCRNLIGSPCANIAILKHKIEQSDYKQNWKRAYKFIAKGSKRCFACIDNDEGIALIAHLDALLEGAAEYLEMDPHHWNKDCGEFEWGEHRCRYEKFDSHMLLEINGKELRVDRYWPSKPPSGRNGGQ